MDPSTRITEYLEAGLRAAHLRQAVIAGNIANMATPGYRRYTVPFEQVFAEALEKGEPVRYGDIVDRVSRPMTGEVNEFGNDVHLETEIGDLVKNSLLYKTYARLLARTYQQMEMAISVGRDG